MIEIEFETNETAASKFNLLVYLAAILISIVAIVSLIIFWLHQAPVDFPVGETINIESGLTATEIVQLLQEKEVVRSSKLLYVVLVTQYDPASIKAGGHVFTAPLSTSDVARIITESSPPKQLVSVTLPEGFTVKEFAKIASVELGEFDSEEFIELASTSEGYLFPETYFVPTDYTAPELFDLLAETYLINTQTIRTDLESNKLTETGVLTLASIIEREANTPDSMSMVSSVLNNRLLLGMPLQADASIEYVLEKPLNELVPADLKIDSEYNTYLYKGLPPTPIGNPGLMAIKAALYPAESDYYFYITDNNGEFYYAKTYAGHKLNIARHLR